MVIKNKPDRELLHKLYVEDGLSLVNIAKIYNCDPTTIHNWLKSYNIQFKNIIIDKLSKELLYNLYIEKELSLSDIAKIYKCAPKSIYNWLKSYRIQVRNIKDSQQTKNHSEKCSNSANKRWEDPLEREKARNKAIKQWEAPKAREVASKRGKKRCEDPLVREKLKEVSSNYWKDDGHRNEQAERVRKFLIKRYENPLEREKQRKTQLKRWSDPIVHEKASATHQGISYDKWEGFSDISRPHLIPVKQCIHLNPWFEGCNQHHIMSGVIINIPVDLHKEIKHRMHKDNRVGKNMKKINKLAFKYLLGII